MIGHYIWVIIIGFVAGLIARFIIPGPNNLSGFIMTTVLGVVGSIIANFIAVKAGWIGPGEGGQLLSGVVGAVILLLVYHFIASRSATTTV